MTPLQQWEVIYTAYNQAGFNRILKDVFLKGKKSQLWQVWVVTVILIFWTLIMLPEFLKTPHLFINYGMFILLLFLFPIVLERKIKITYESHYKNYQVLIKAYKKDREFLRYLLFKENIESYLKTKKEEINFNQMKNFIEEKLKIAQASIFKEHPFIISLIGIITAIAGGGSSIEAGWTYRITPFILLVLLGILFHSIHFVELFKSKEYKLHELKKFILWREQEIPQK